MTEQLNEDSLTFSPLCVCGDQFIDKCDIFKPLPLGLTDEFWVAAFVGPKQVQVEHHLSTLAVRESLNELTTLTLQPGCQILFF